ncbi:MAG: hypothetical protein AAGD92_02250 [Pseudomonadota bacterium]
MGLNLTGPDFVGLIGVAFVVGTYFLSQVGRMDVNHPLYPGLNAIGALFILFSLSHTFNTASFVIEMFWLLISAVGLIRSLFLRRRKARE